MKKKFTIFVVLLAGIIYTGHAQGVQWIYQQKQEKKNMKNLSEIYFAGGCFWGTDHFLKQIRGVKSTQSDMPTETLLIRLTNRCVQEKPILQKPLRWSIIHKKFP